MKRIAFFLVMCCVFFVTRADISAPTVSNTIDLPEIKLDLPTNTTLYLPNDPTAHALSVMDSILEASTQAYTDDKEAQKAAYRAKYGTYTPLKELELTSVPLIAFGFIAKGQKKNFRAARNNFIPSYKNGMDDYIQFVPAWTAYALNLAGYKGRSSFKRLFFSSGFSFAFMGLFINSIKYSAAEMRPDGSTANSFPSGHTATAFTCATILHKEYGLTRSPWFSVGAYSISTLTGIMRTLNNRHWISDILVGAGLGVISTDLGYMMADFMFKKKGINYTVGAGKDDLILNPSFFKLSLGSSIISDIKLPSEVDYTRYAWLSPAPDAPDIDTELFPIATHGDPFKNANQTIRNNRTIKVGTATSVGAEAAYFINPYVGVGARVRIATAPVYADGLHASTTIDGKTYQNNGSASDIMSVTDWSAGLYGSIPFTKHFAIGSKLLYGRRYTGSIDLSGACDFDYKLNDETLNLTFYGDSFEISAANTDLFSTGLNATYTMGNGTALSVFWDYDFSHTDYDVSYWPEHDDPDLWITGGRQFTFRQRVNTNTIGASLTVMF